jgi:hypothetical protein
MKRLATLIALCALLALPLLAADTPAKPSAACCLKSAGTQRTVTNLDNGVKITMTAKDPRVAAMIQEHAASCPKDDPGCKDCPMAAEGVNRTVEKTESGVVITATSANPELVKKLQAHAATCGSGNMKGCYKGRAGAQAMGAGHACSYAKNSAMKQS